LWCTRYRVRLSGKPSGEVTTFIHCWATSGDLRARMILVAAEECNGQRACVIERQSAPGPGVHHDSAVDRAR
jgi:hypothetical protein